MDKQNLQFRVKIALYAISTLLMMSVLASSILASIDVHFPTASMGTVQLILTMPALTAIICALVAGPLSEWIPKKTLVLIGIGCMLLGGVASFALGRRSIALLIVAAGFIGIGQGSLSTLTTTLIAAYFEGDDCRKLLGQQSAFVNVGSVAFVFAATELARFGWHLSYLVYLLLVPIWIAVLLLLPARSPGETQNHAAPGTSREPIRLNRRVFYLCAVLFVFATFMYVFLLNVSMAVTEWGLGDVKTAGYANTTLTLAGLACGLLYPYIHRLCKNFIFAVGILLAGVGLLTMYFVGNLFSVFFAAICCGTGLTIMIPSSLFSAANAVNAASSSTAIAIVSAMSNLGMFLSGILLEPIVNAFGGGLSTYFIVGAVGLFALGIVAIGEAFWQNSKQTQQGT